MKPTSPYSIKHCNTPSSPIKSFLQFLDFLLPKHDFLEKNPSTDDAQSSAVICNFLSDSPTDKNAAPREAGKHATLFSKSK